MLLPFLLYTSRRIRSISDNEDKEGEINYRIHSGWEYTFRGSYGGDNGSPNRSYYYLSKTRPPSPTSVLRHKIKRGTKTTITVPTIWVFMLNDKVDTYIIYDINFLFFWDLFILVSVYYIGLYYYY